MDVELDLDDDEGEEELADVEVERMPDLGGWEFFKAVDDGAELWTLALQHRHDAIAYAFWTDIKKDPSVTGTLEVHREADRSWARAVRQAIKGSEDGSLDNAARAEVILALLRQHDPTLDSYEARLLFTLDPPPDDENEDKDEAEDEEA